jgi:hypothetical protein
MTILNLNGPAGREPRSKKTVRAWMGVGLVIAVLGLGSTFAANISIANNNESEFGQGVTKTVYCGAGEDEITITPVSAFVPEVENYNAGRAAVPSSWIAPTWTGTPSFQEVDSSSSKYSFTSTYVNDASGAPSSVKGYWVQSRSSGTYYQGNNNSPSGYEFVPQAVGNSSTAWASRSSSSSTSGSQKYGYWKFQSWNPGSMSIAVARIAPTRSVTPSRFEVRGITVSDIDEECAGRDFVISAYNTSNEALNLINTKAEIAVLYGDRTGNATFSFDRTGQIIDTDGGSTAVTEVPGKFSIAFNSGTRMRAELLKNIVIETQDDLLDSNNDDDEEED